MDGPPADDAGGPTPLYENAVYWYPALVFPKAAALVFDDAALRGILCDYCRALSNLVVGADGRVAQVFCRRCCTMIGQHATTLCTGGSPRCVGHRYVDGLGAIALLCRECHRAAEPRSKFEKRRAAARHRPRGPAPVSLAAYAACALAPLGEASR
jgi:hypothetical protein